MKIRSSACVPVLREFSRLPEKRDVYAVDPYYREGWEDMLEGWGDSSVCAARLKCVAPIIFRPDAVVTRSIPRALALLSERGFTPIAVRRFRYNRHSIREGWRYQLNVATRERIDVMDMIMTATDSLYVVLADRAALNQIPACTRLSEYKGPSLPSERQAHHLRRQMCTAQVSVLTMVHVPDEPADIVRELAVFFDAAERRELLSRIAEGRPCDTELSAEVESLHANTPSHDLAFAAALERVGLALDVAERPTNPTHSGAHARALALLAAIREGQSRSWRALFEELQGANLTIDPWDRTAIAAFLSTRHVEGAASILPDVKLDEWMCKPVKEL